MSQYIFNPTKDNIDKMHRDVLSRESRDLNAKLRQLIAEDNAKQAKRTKLASQDTQMNLWK